MASTPEPEPALQVVVTAVRERVEARVATAARDIANAFSLQLQSELRFSPGYVEVALPREGSMTAATLIEVIVQAYIKAALPVAYQDEVQRLCEQVTTERRKEAARGTHR